MATPQLENGHTRIANELLEHLMMFHLSPNQWQVLLCIIRKTYGYQKKVDYIANSQIVEATGLGKTVVSRALHILEDIKIINRNKKNIGIEKDWEKWRKLAEPLTTGTKLAEPLTDEKLAIQSTELAIQSTELAEQLTKVSSPVVTQKKKETIQKKLYKRKYGEFQNVLLSDNEYQKLLTKFGENNCHRMIETLSGGMKANSKYKYSDHYAAILNWQRRGEEGGSNGTNRGNFEAAEGKKPYTRPPTYTD